MNSAIVGPPSSGTQTSVGALGETEPLHRGLLAEDRLKTEYGTECFSPLTQRGNHKARVNLEHFYTSLKSIRSITNP